ncbi:MAG: hypothetical protein OSA93_05965 [Akkermansiaceae bacterium]|jgi:hypothetical protein|nr:hypothetical protein [Akkermansiaceae bacterium]
MANYFIKSGLRAGAGGFTATIIFLFAILWIYQSDLRHSNMSDSMLFFLLGGFCFIAILPSILMISAVTKSVEIGRKAGTITIRERSLIRSRSFVINPGSDFTWRVRVWASRSSYISVMGDVEGVIASGMVEADLYRIDEALKNLSEQCVGE